MSATARHDALYCFESATVPPEATIGQNCSEQRPSRQEALQLVQGSFAGAFDRIDNPKDTSQRGLLPYNRNHRYPVTFKARSTGKLQARHRVAYNDRSGAFLIELMAPEKKVKRCGRSGKAPPPALIASACGRWVVDFAAVQDGFPSNTLQPAYKDLIGTETTIVGKMFFNAKPKKNKRAVGNVAAVALHSDQFLAPLVFTVTEDVLLLTPTPTFESSYLYGPDKTEVLIGLEIDDTELGDGPPRPIDAPGSKAASRLEDLTGTSGRLVWQTYRGLVPMSHAHVWDDLHPESNRLAVRVSLPKPL